MSSDNDGGPLRVPQVVIIPLNAKGAARNTPVIRNTDGSCLSPPKTTPRSFEPLRCVDLRTLYRETHFPTSPVNFQASTSNRSFGAGQTAPAFTRAETDCSDSSHKVEVLTYGEHSPSTALKSHLLYQRELSSCAPFVRDVNRSRYLTHGCRGWRKRFLVPRTEQVQEFASQRLRGAF